MKMDGIAGFALIALIVCGALRLLNVVLYRIGGIGVLIALLALAYGFVRKNA